ncbi:MAG: lysine--tRNA ligase [Candidatus Ryanbacteria bacterium RIFCSPHIGHO2_02_FULL_48_12]|uniref:Lysine--tRNA ligase n=1 Tax=Candidatus Ryanbacteria bacterium RIFCSPHIGHO2_01_FULL_48_27 TaxID=1802115 RepID=A0A1G2G5Y9_9BACT|nr:MAG: lysine--tRNA ligase [Candidatus Ryanbacteria bacterium RIFCSPHIGHO2_01_FULL_48_27]OGZ50165.1 MAG: lysine--tRNA ligase [Candidatus Ryanbacteria bacterium RIFCSPHIGHO2_02_FULL_48_12]
MSLEDIRSARLHKLSLIEEAGIDPYPAHTDRTHEIADALGSFAKLEKQKKPIVLAGRVRASREHGGSTFVDVEDGTGKIQVYFKRDEMDGESYDTLQRTLDIGDFIEVTGGFFVTKRGEKSLLVASWKFLAKSLLPLPEKWHGLQDVEERFRKRYLDTLMNEEVRERFRTRSLLIRAIRSFLDTEGFLEVETPMLHSIAGGAIAKPFKTHHNALDIDLFLRIAPELYLKRLLVGGFDKVYELGRNFRNEGIDLTHNPEFTMLEWYAAYWDEEEMMAFVERLFHQVLKTLGKKDTLEVDGRAVVFAPAFPRITFKELLSRYALIVDYDGETRDSLATKARTLGIEVAPHEAKGKIADEIFKKVCRPHIMDATFVTNHPVDISPLAKKNPLHAGEVRRFQLVVASQELVNAFSELNDPIDQRRRFEEQERMKTAGDAELHSMDTEYVEALEHGMPPAAGAGIGIDRLAMLLTDAKNIREVLFFPTLRPKRDNED